MVADVHAILGPAEAVLLPSLHVGKVEEPARLGVGAEIPVHDVRLLAEAGRLQGDHMPPVLAGARVEILELEPVVVDGVGREHLEHGHLHRIGHVARRRKHVELGGIVTAVRIAPAQAVGVGHVLLAADAHGDDAVLLLHVTNGPGIHHP